MRAAIEAFDAGADVAMISKLHPTRSHSGAAEGGINAVGGKTVVLATGGAGRQYRVTTNAYACTGDGMAMALHAGLPLKDMEFMQFHPTTLYPTGILLTEGCRGEGAYLINKEGERFMKHYAPNALELAARDVVSRSEQTETDEGRRI